VYVYEYCVDEHSAVGGEGVDGGWLQGDNTTLRPLEVVKIPETRLSNSESIFLPSPARRIQRRIYARVSLFFVCVRHGKIDRFIY
jgi:hypothetical protein